MKDLRLQVKKKLPDGSVFDDSHVSGSIIDLLVHVSHWGIFDRTALYYMAMGVVVTDMNGVEWWIERVR